MKFKKGDIVSHTKTIDRFYIVIECIGGQYLVEDIDKSISTEKYIFMENYLLSKTDRRDYVLGEILNKD